jgi:predicted choloylglycine hydrolase
MNRNFNIINGKFHHLILEGTAYEVGKRQGEILKGDEEMRTRIERSVSSFSRQLGASQDGKPDLEKMGFQDFDELQGFFEDYCPGLNEEMKGFADSLGVEINVVPFYGATYNVSKNCSQAAVLSSATNDKHVYVGRSYEWTHTEEDLRLCTTRVKGKAAHIGFSIFLFGRADGLNEHGVSVTFVDDAIELIQKIPISGFFNLLIADRDSNAVLVEFADGTRDVRQMNNNSKGKYLFSTNHYTLPATKKSNELNCGIIGQSQKRYQLLASNLSAASEIKKEALRMTLSRKFPKGLCDHYYSDGFGTVWSMIFDLTTIEADICFGAPTHNKWRPFTLDEPSGVKEYRAIFPDATGKWPY